MLADERTLETLDFASVRESVARNTRTEAGARRARTLAPTDDFEAVRFQQSATAQVRELVTEADMHILAVRDVEGSVEAAARGAALGAEDLRAIADAIGAAAAAYNKARERTNDATAQILAPYRPLKELGRSLTDAIDERGSVLDRASPALTRIRKSLQQAQSDARDRVSALLRSAKHAKAIQDAIVTIREGRYVVPIKAEFSGEFPGIVHDTSSSGQTLFVEPLAALDANNRLRTYRLDEEREVARVLAELSRMVGSNAPQLAANLDILATLDVLVAKARSARAMDAERPELTDDATIAISEGRHPLLGDRAVPQSLTLDEETRILVISGPNMGGKTVTLKAVGLFVAMTYAGLQLPTRLGTRIGRFTNVVTDIGDEQSIAQNASTFSAHLARTRDILARADDRTLILIDEIGGGTEPSSGAALAVAMLERFLAIRARCVVTTHATELKLFAHGKAHVSNASVRFDPATFVPTYHLDVGMPGQSLAFPLARTTGIAPEVIARAERLLSTRERDYESALADLSQINAQLQSERAALAQEREFVRLEHARTQQETSDLENEQRRFGERAEARMREALAEFSRELQRRTKTRSKITASQSQLLSETLDAMHRDLNIVSRHENGEAGGPFRSGEAVHILPYRQDGTVVADNGDTLLVAMGALKAVVSKTEVRRTQNVSKTRAAHESGQSARLDAVERATAELDVRGKRFVEAEPEVESWIDGAILAGTSPMRLIHGKGSGLLGRGLQEYLRSHPSVKNVRYGDENEGGGGVTVFELR